MKRESEPKRGGACSHRISVEEKGQEGGLGKRRPGNFSGGQPQKKKKGGKIKLRPSLIVREKKKKKKKSNVTTEDDSFPWNRKGEKSASLVILGKGKQERPRKKKRKKKKKKKKKKPKGQTGLWGTQRGGQAGREPEQLGRDSKWEWGNIEKREKGGSRTCSGGWVLQRNRAAAGLRATLAPRKRSAKKEGGKIKKKRGKVFEWKNTSGGGHGWGKKKPSYLAVSEVE